jgi:hypothetical protein
MSDDHESKPKIPYRLWQRTVAGFALALTVALSIYLLINASRAYGGWIASVWFLAILPAFLCALICYVGDPDRDRRDAFYWLVPPILVAAVVLGSAFFLHEGIICLIMLSPIWLISGWIGAFTLRALYRRPVESGVLRSSFLLLPLMCGAIESQLPFPNDQVILERQIVVRATPDEIWPYALANAHIDDAEGRWTFSQNIVGLPRPRATEMRGQGVGAVRVAYWADKISFEERITQWRPGEWLAWSFSFANSSLQEYTDQHIAPDGQFLKIDAGEYRLEPVTADTTLLTLSTRYIAKTHVNLYAELWGDLLLGDIENNILSIIKQRAEAAHDGAGAAAR